MTLDQAIERLRQLYAAAGRSIAIKDPLLWALAQVLELARRAAKEGR